MTSSKPWSCRLWSICLKFWYGLKTIQHVSVPNLKLFGPVKTELWAKKFRGFSFTLYGKMGWWAFFCPPAWLPQYKCMETFKLWTAVTLGFNGISGWNLQRPLKMGLFTMCKHFVKKVVNLNFWRRHCIPKILFSVTRFSVSKPLPWI